MQFKVISDLHVDINKSQTDKMLFDEDAFYLIAGDVSGDRDTTARFLFGKKLKGVFVEGNHLGYNQLTFNKFDTKEKSNEYLKWEFTYDNKMTFLENDYIEIGDTLVIGCTLYTDFNLFHNAPIHSEVARVNMNDFRYVKVWDNNTTRKVSPQDYVDWFTTSVAYIDEICNREENKDTKIVVLTHFAPSFKSISVEYQNDVLTPAYASELDEFILKHPNIKAWVHGHVHHQTTYKIGDCQVVCNPYGYYNENRMDLAQPLGYDLEV